MRTGQARSRIWIWLDVVFGPDEPRCVDPGLTNLGTSANFRHAYYTGDLRARPLPARYDER
ncbi:DUF6355 family natural product biosynthesis protein [Amycolatopsis sp. cmx-11-12]|uniref:DUF6355 family natural product biosynthesis protein n=1 Tax=Amycolatopsis sp. cmx-11-12 TaxID=2785795 RepID=UPI0039185E37